MCPGYVQATPANSDSHVNMNACWADALAGDGGGVGCLRMPCNSVG